MKPPRLYARDPATHVGIALLIDGVEVECDVPEGGTMAALSGLSVTWGRSTVLDAPAASTCNFTLVAGADYTATVRDRARVAVYAVAPDGTRTEVFMGLVSDVEVTHDDAPGTDTEVAVTAIDMSARLASMPLRGVFSSGLKVTFPAQTATARRTAMRSLMDVRAAALETPVFADGAGTSALAAYEADDPKAWDAWAALYAGLGFEVWPVGKYSEALLSSYLQMVATYATVSPYPYTRDISRASARVPLAPLTHETTTAKAPLPAPVLRACDVDLDGTSFGTGTGVVDTSGTSLQVNYTDSAGESRGVMRGNSTQVVTLDSLVDNATDAGESADRLWNTVPSSSGGFKDTWTVEGVTIDPDSVTETDNFHQAMLAMLDQAARILRPVLLFELPPWVPWRYATDPTLSVDNIVALLNGGTYTYTDGRWVLGLVLVVQRPATSSVATRVVVSPGSSVTVAHDDPAVVPSPGTRWSQQYATFSDGRYIWSGSAWVAPLYVSAGDAPAVAHTNWQVIPAPETAWPSGASALFTDGPYGWTGTAWTARSMTPQVWGEYPTLPHDDPRWTEPASVWAGGNYATFSDGPFRYASSAGTGVWNPVTLTEAGDTVAGATADAGPVPHTAWDHTYATFTISGGGTRRWDGTAWVRVNVVQPGGTYSWPSTDPNTVPEPHTAWATGQYVTLSDGAFRWNGSAWVAVTITATPYADVPADHDDARVVASPATTWEHDEYATFTDGEFGWDGAAWQPVTWTVQRINLATNPRGVLATNWSWSPGFGGVAAITMPTGTDTPDGEAGYRRATITTPDTGGFAGHGYTEPVTGTVGGNAGDVATLSMYVRPSVALTYTLNCSTRVGGLTGDSAASAPTPAPAGVWTRLAASITATKAYEGMRLNSNESVAGPAAGSTIDACCVLLEVGTTTGTYFDGSSPDTDTERHAWKGAANASASTLSTPYWGTQDTTWGGAPADATWNDVPAGMSWDDWTGDI